MKPELNNSGLSRRRMLKMMGVGVVSLGLGGCQSLPFSSDKNKPFSLIALPDTQVYTWKQTDLFLAQTNWIAENVKTLNIAGVFHEGDITHMNTVPEWEAANAAMSRLDGVVPYFMALGNHDYPECAKVRDATLFNQYFPASRFESQPWYGGHYPGGNENAYYFFRAGGCRFLVICLEFGPRDDVLAWARQVADRHADCPAIVVTHCYTNFDCTRVGEGDQYNPHDYGCKGNDGEEIWTKLISRQSNIFLVLSGHILDDGLGRLTTDNQDGKPVHQVLANYQMKENGGNGWLRIMTFDPALGTIEFKTYSPVLDQFATDEQNNFTLPMSQQSLCKS